MEERWRTSSGIRQPELVFLGRASYALYLLHLPIYGWAGTLSPDAGAFSSLAAILVAVIASAIAFMLCEELARHALLRRLVKKSALARGAAQA